MAISRSLGVVTFKFPGFIIECAPLWFGARAFFVSGLQLGGLELVEKRVEALKVVLPKAAVALEPSLKLLERGGAQGIDAALRVHTNVNEAGVAEDAEMLGDLGLAEAEAADQVADGAGAVAQEFDDMKAVGLGEGAEGSHHGRGRICFKSYIRVKAYSKERIYKSSFSQA
jgi:hypothetical protein